MLQYAFSRNGATNIGLEQEYFARVSMSMTPRRRVTMQDIADHCGVSRNTVSKALRGHPKISQATTDKVKAVAAELGYLPDPQLSRIMTQLNELRNKKQTMSESVVYLDCCATEGDIASHPNYFNGAKDFLETRGYRLLLMHYPDNPQAIEDLKRKLNNLGVRGIIIGPRKPDVRRIHLDWERFAMVAIGFHLDFPKVDHVGTNHYHNGRVCFEQLWKKGCRRIGLIMPGILDDLHDNFHKSTYLGMAELFQMKARIPILDINRNGTYRLRKDETIEWLETHQIDGVLSWDEDPPVQREALNEVNPEIPLALLQVNIHFAEAGIRPRSSSVGYVAARELVANLALEAYGEPVVPRRTLIEGEWGEG